MGKPSLAERAKVAIKSIKYPFLWLAAAPREPFMSSLSSGSNSTLPHEASMPFEDR